MKSYFGIKYTHSSLGAARAMPHSSASFISFPLPARVSVSDSQGNKEFPEPLTGKLSRVQEEPNW